LSDSRRADHGAAYALQSRRRNVRLTANNAGHPTRSFARSRDPFIPEEVEALSWKQLTFLATSLVTPSVEEESGGVAVIEANGGPK
jgi:hypothetical protein